MNVLLAALHRLLQRARRAPAEAADTLLLAETAEEEAEEQAEERPLGCGWFDSSHELHSGLLVREHASVDTLGCELPLASWLELQLSGWRAPQSVMPAI